MKKQINMTDSDCDLGRFSSREELLALLDGFDGLELMCFGEDISEKIPAGRVIGVHTVSLPFWYDFWTGNTRRCLEELGDEETLKNYYGGSGQEVLLAHYRRDIRAAERLGAKYMVFHVSDCTAEETMSGKFAHTDEEVTDAFCDILNRLFPEDWAGPEILVENLWQPGFTFLDPAMTKRLMDGIRCRRKGIMLDTGHLMNTDTALRTPAEATAYIDRLLDKHGDLCRHIRGVHLNLSLSGEYAEYVKTHLPDLSGSYEERSRILFEYIFKKDQHRPYIGGGVETLIERIRPEYLTLEFITKDIEEHRAFIRKQKEALPGVFKETRRRILS